MKYLVKTTIRKRNKRPKVLYVSDTHTFDLKGNQIISLTDAVEYAQDFSIDEASDFIKANKGFSIEEQEDDYFDEEEDEDE